MYSIGIYSVNQSTQIGNMEAYWPLAIVIGLIAIGLMFAGKRMNEQGVTWEDLGGKHDEQ